MQLLENIYFDIVKWFSALVLWEQMLFVIGTLYAMYLVYDRRYKAGILLFLLLVIYFGGIISALSEKSAPFIEWQIVK